MKPGCQQGKIQPYFFLFCFIQQIDAYQYRPAGFYDLQDQVQVAFQTGGIADYDNRVRFTEADEIPCDFLFCRMGHEGIAAGYIHKRITMLVEGTGSPGIKDGLAGPVACMLLQAGKGIENRAFSHIGIPGQGDGCRRLIGHGNPPFSKGYGRHPPHAGR